VIRTNIGLKTKSTLFDIFKENGPLEIARRNNGTWSIKETPSWLAVANLLYIDINGVGFAHGQ